MAIYLLIDIVIIVCGLLFLKLTKKEDRIKAIGSDVYFIIAFLLLFFIAAFRGDFTADYIGYEEIYTRYFSYSLTDILALGLDSYPEQGYLLFQFAVKNIFGNVLYIFIFTSLFVVFANLRELKKWFPLSFVPVLLFADMGTYITSFNVTRQIVAVSIMILGSKFLYDKKPIKYFLVVAIAALFHSSALIMIPAYFFFNFKQKRSRMYLYAIGVAALFVLLPLLLKIVQTYLWGWYNTEGLLSSGYSYKNIVAPLFISLPPIIKYNFSKTNPLEQISRHESIWLNGTYLYLIFALLGLRISLSSRFASFFSIFAILAFAKCIEDIKDRKSRFLVTCGAVALICAYNFVVKLGSPLDPFYFIWQR